MYDCPQCGESTIELHEGYCAECCTDNQRALDLHNAEYDRWQNMTDNQRKASVRAAVHLAPGGRYAISHHRTDDRRQL